MVVPTFLEQAYSLLDADRATRKCKDDLENLIRHACKRLLALINSWFFRAFTQNLFD